MVKDKDGKFLSEEDEAEYTDDLWDMGVPASADAAFRLWEKWGERLGIEKPKGYEEWAVKQICSP